MTALDSAPKALEHTPQATRVSIFMNRSNQAIRIPKAMSFPGATELEARKEGDVLTLRPVKPSLASFLEKYADVIDEFEPERADLFDFNHPAFGQDEV